MFNLFRKARPEVEQAVSDEPNSPLSEVDIVINGHVQGSVQGRCDVIVDLKGHCVGSFVVKDLCIHGTVIGDVCADQLTIHPTGQLYYRTVSAQKTIVHDGGIYTEQRDKQSSSTTAQQKETGV